MLVRRLKIGLRLSVSARQVVLFSDKCPLCPIPLVSKILQSKTFDNGIMVARLPHLEEAYSKRGGYGSGNLSGAIVSRDGAERPLGLAGVYFGQGTKDASPFPFRARVRNLRTGFSGHGRLGLCALSGP